MLPSLSESTTLFKLCYPFPSLGPLSPPIPHECRPSFSPKVRFSPPLTFLFFLEFNFSVPVSKGARLIPEALCRCPPKIVMKLLFFPFLSLCECPPASLSTNQGPPPSFPPFIPLPFALSLSFASPLYLPPFCASLPETAIPFEDPPQPPTIG